MRYLPKTLLGYPFRRVEIRYPDQSSSLGYVVLTPKERVLLVPEMHGGSLYYAVNPRGRPPRSNATAGSPTATDTPKPGAEKPGVKLVSPPLDKKGVLCYTTHRNNKPPHTLREG